MNTRDRVREIISAEVARSDPIEDARRPLELIVETSLRYPATGNEAVVTVVDEAGQPRTKTQNGQVVEFTIADLMEELRAKHPTLFKPPVIKGAESAELKKETGIQADTTPGEDMTAGPRAGESGEPPAVEKAAAPAREPQRDWLLVSAQEPVDQGSSRRSRLLESGHDEGLARRSLGALRSLKGKLGSATAAAAEGLRPARGALMGASDHARAFFDGSRDVFTRRGLTLALGTVFGAALLGILVYAASSIMGRLPDAGAVQQQAAGPPKPSGAVATGALPKTAPSDAPDTNVTDAAPARGVPEVLDTATLYLQGKIVRLYGIEWARGAGEPEDLSRYLRGREVVCQPTDSPETYRCEVDGQDLSKVVLYNGGGKATSDAPPELVAAQARAQSARIGVWSKSQKAEPAQ